MGVGDNFPHVCGDRNLHGSFVFWSTSFPGQNEKFPNLMAFDKTAFSGDQRTTDRENSLRIPLYFMLQKVPMWNPCDVKLKHARGLNDFPDSLLVPLLIAICQSPCREYEENKDRMPPWKTLLHFFRFSVPVSFHDSWSCQFSLSSKLWMQQERCFCSLSPLYKPWTSKTHPNPKTLLAGKLILVHHR